MDRIRSAGNGCSIVLVVVGAAVFWIVSARAQTPPNCSTLTLCSCARPYDCYQPVTCTLPATGGLTLDFQTHLSGVDPSGSTIWPLVPGGDQVDSVVLPPGVTAQMVTPHGPMSCGPPSFSCPTWPYRENCAGGRCELFSFTSPGDCIDRVYASRSSVYAPNPNGTSLYFQDCDHFGAEMAIAGASAEGDVSSPGPFVEFKGGPTGLQLTSSQGQTGTITLSRPTTCMSGPDRVCADYVSAPADSCWGRCGTTAPSGCSCAPTCVVAGNCCADVVNFCSAQANALCVSPPAGLSTDRMGAVATTQVGLVCSGAPCPSSPVTVTATVDDPTQGRIKRPQDASYQTSVTLSFPAGSPAPQTLQIQGRDDQVTYGDRKFTVNLAATSAASEFSGKSLPVVVKNVDRTDHAACIPQVENKFWAIPTHLTDAQKLPILFQQPPFAEYGFSECAGIPFPGYTTLPCSEHFEGIARLKSGPFMAISGRGREASHLMIHKLAAKTGVLGRWDGNFTTWDNDYMVNWDSYVVDTANDHAGGISVFGDFAAVPVESTAGDHPVSWVAFYDLYDPAHPVRVGTTLERPFHFSGAVTVTKRGGRYLMAVMSNDPAAIHFYQSSGGDIRQPQTWTFLNSWLPTQNGYPYACFGVLPALAATIQNMTFVEQCDGKLYMAVTWNRGDLANGCLWPWSDNLIRLYEVDLATVVQSPNPVSFRVVGARTFDCRSDLNIDYCNFAHAANLFPDPVTRDLILYGAWGYTEGLYTSTGWHWFALASEFSSQMATPTGVTASQNLADRVRVSWSAVGGAASYAVLRDGVPIGTATASPFEDTTAAPCARPKYSVQATNAQGQSSPPSATALGFRSIVPVGGVPFAPALVAPSNGQFVPPPVLLDWDPSCDALTYGVEVATSSGFAPATIVYSATGLTDTSATAQVAPGGPYYWRARGTTALGLIGAWSATRSFSAQAGCGGVCSGQTCTACPGDCSTLVSPADGATAVPVAPTLDWTDLAGATAYDVQVATDAGFANVVRSASPSSSSWAVTPALAGGTTYHWRVRATATCGAGSWTGARSFTTAEPGYVDCGGSCTNLALGKTVTYSGLWNAVSNPATKVNDGNTGTTSACEGSSGYCAIASTAGGAQGVGNYLRIDLGGVMSVKSVTVYGRRDTALTQGQNLNLRLSTDGVNWTTTFMPDTTNSAGLTVTTGRLARYVSVETTTNVYLSLYEIVVSGTGTYGDCGTSCGNIALGKAVTASGLWNPSGNPATKVNDGNTGTTSACEGASGYCAIASTPGGAQGVGNYLQIDLGAVESVKSVTVYGRRDTALTQGQNLNLKLSTDGVNWTTTFMPDTTSALGHLVSTATLARYVRVETTTNVYLSLYEIVVTGKVYTDCGGTCSSLGIGKPVSASGLWNPSGNPATKVNDGNTGTTSACEGASGYCAIASTPGGAQAIGNFLQIDLGSNMSVKSVTVHGRRDAALGQAQNLNLKLSSDGVSWTTTFLSSTTSVSGLTVSTARLARFVRVETTTVNYLSLYEVTVTGAP